MRSSLLNLIVTTAIVTVTTPSLSCASAASEAVAEEGWISLFNGKDLEGWTVKVAKHPLGVNYADTFRVEDGAIKVSYEKYGIFDEQFAHLYSNLPYSHYILRLEYRFSGTAIADAPAWAKLNSGVMIHSQSPLSMRIDQPWPVSMEFQFLAVGTTAGRQTGNVCTPGTHLERNGHLSTDHIVDAIGALSPLDEWVAVEIEVRGNEQVIHRVKGEEVLRYQHPQLDLSDPDAKRLLALGSPRLLSRGHIALQAESQPVWFRNIRLKVLDSDSE